MIYPEHNNHAHFSERTAQRYGLAGFLFFMLVCPFADVIFR
jgi:hypothetical protein